MVVSTKLAVQTTEKGALNVSRSKSTKRRSMLSKRSSKNGKVDLLWSPMRLIMTLPDCSDASDQTYLGLAAEFLADVFERSKPHGTQDTFHFYSPNLRVSLTVSISRGPPPTSLKLPLPGTLRIVPNSSSGSGDKDRRSRSSSTPSLPRTR